MSFPPVCPPAPAPPTITNHNRRIHSTLPTIIFSDLSSSPDSTSTIDSPAMKAQSITSTSSRSRLSSYYPTSKRVSVGPSSYRHGAQAVSPSSMSAASVSKRRSPWPTQSHRSYPSSSASSDASSVYSSSSVSSTSSRSSSRFATARLVSAQKSQLAQQHHQRALLAQRTASRYSEVSSLDRGIRLLLEEEYREDVKAWMLEKEKLTIPSVAAMDQQPELQWHMRAHLLDFLLEIHLHFRLRPETLYLTLSILDRYVSRRIVYKKHYQLVGCVSLWLASKFEDAKERVPTVRDLKELCHGAYEEGAFVQMEGHVLGTVEWDLGHPTAESWMRVLCTETHLDNSSWGDEPQAPSYSVSYPESTPFEDTKTQHVARFLMEMTLFGQEYLSFAPSVIALAALTLARYICGKGRRQSDESAETLALINLLDNTLAQNLSSVSQVLVKKYSYAYYSKASGVVVSFYLRGGRFPIREMAESVERASRRLNGQPVKPASLTPNFVAVQPAAPRPSPIPPPPSTPIRSRAASDHMSWGSGSSVGTTPGLVRSESTSSVSSSMEVDAYGDYDDDADASSSASIYANSDCEVDMVPSSAADGDDEDESECEMEADQQLPPVTTLPGYAAGVLGLTLDASSDDSGSMPITPITPFYGLTPFEAAQAAALAAAAQRDHVAAANARDASYPKGKENAAPHGHVRSHSRSNSQSLIPCQGVNVPGVVGVVEGSSGEEMVMGEYRPALLTIVP